MKKACTEDGWVRYGNFGLPIFGRDQSGNHDTDLFGVEKPVILAQKCVKNVFGHFLFSWLLYKPYINGVVEGKLLTGNFYMVSSLSSLFKNVVFMVTYYTTTILGYPKIGFGRSSVNFN